MKRFTYNPERNADVLDLDMLLQDLSQSGLNVIVVDSNTATRKPKKSKKQDVRVEERYDEQNDSKQ